MIPTLQPAAGGTAEVVKVIGNAQQQLGHTVEALASDPPDAPWVAAAPFKVNALGPGFLKYGFNSALYPWLLQHAGSYDAIFVHGLWQYSSFVTWRALRRLGITYYVFPHGMLDPWFKETYPLKHLKKWLYWPWSDYRVLRDARAVLFTSEQERLASRRSFWLYRCSERVVSLGTNAPCGDPDIQRDAFFSQFPTLRGKRIILFMGRLHEKKGCDLLIKAFSNLVRTTSACDICLVMAGPDSTPEFARSLRTLVTVERLDDFVSWTGLLSGDLKWGAFRAAEVFILPSHQENFGLAVSESLSTGLPVLISDKVNIAREVEQDGAGLVGKDDVAGTCALLTNWFSLTPEYRAEMRVRALRCFTTRFEAGRAARSILETLETGISGNGAGER